MQVLNPDCKDAETDERMHQKMVEQMDDLTEDNIQGVHQVRAMFWI